MTDLVYILAASHSGSTLLAMLLGANPDLCTMGELRAAYLDDVDNYRCSCGNRIRECSFWTNISQAMNERQMPFEITHAGTDFSSIDSRYVRRLLRPLHRGTMLEQVRDVALWLSPAWRDQYPRIQQRNATLTETICTVRSAKLIVDSSKTALRLKYLLRNPDLRVRVIRLIRDGRGVALSYMDPANFADATDPTLRGGGTGGQRDNERLSIDEAAHEWRRSNEEAERVLAGIDRSTWIQVRYEQLCADPETTLGQIFSFLDLKPCSVVDSFRDVEHHVIGNGMRLDTTSEIRLDERWRKVLTTSQLNTFERVAGDLNRRHEYV
jgi:hypothetical protein